MTARRGTVLAFRDDRGDGTLRDDDGAEYYVHCVEITDGSRTLTPGERVTFVAVVGHLGRDEAAEVQSSL